MEFASSYRNILAKICYDFTNDTFTIVVVVADVIVP